MQVLLAISRAIDTANAQIGKVATWLVLLACLVSTGNAFSRYGFNLSSNGWLEIQWYMFSGIVLLGAAYTLSRNGHVRVDIFYGRLSPRAQIWVDVLGGILFLLPAMVLLAWLSWPVFFESFARSEMSSNAGGLIRWPVKLLMPVGFAFIALQGISEIIKRIAMLTGDMPVNVHYERPLQ